MEMRSCPKGKKLLEQHHIPFEEKGHNIEKLVACDIIVKSPGISNTSSILQTLTKCRKEIHRRNRMGFPQSTWKDHRDHGQQWQDYNDGIVSSFSAFSRNRMQQKLEMWVKDFVIFLLRVQADWYVCELSSFQLEDIETFRPEVAILLNITPDHLDRYDYSLDKYADAKMKIVQAMNGRRIY